MPGDSFCWDGATSAGFAQCTVRMAFEVDCDVEVWRSHLVLRQIPSVKEVLWCGHASADKVPNISLIVVSRLSESLKQRL